MTAGIFLNLNYTAVILAGFVYFLLSLLWYTPKNFRRIWIRFNFMNPDNPAATNKIISMALLSTVLASLILAFFIKATGAQTAVAGMGIGTLAGLAVMASTTGMSFMIVGRELKFCLADTGYHLTGFMLMGMILSMWV